MKNNIYSTFNLSKSLSKFQEKVTKVLELTNISEFDVQVFKFREEKIRESALVLAGECIALLLNDLSNSQEFLDKAMQQTQGWWHEKTQRHGYKKRQIWFCWKCRSSFEIRGEMSNRTETYAKAETVTGCRLTHNIAVKTCLCFQLTSAKLYFQINKRALTV